ncbi:Uu.00g123000.m01.CDS01 [Anthostomella pinea]|uniref:Uu.00g123000.m01.CDS01 n=1 Tax=Anthostomella pinea TaxID=933095 RepID=A0AAI8YHH1_9PEZI|nr:Uu.00g123000.m01.CDS01 [Anthostomella pinea]
MVKIAIAAASSQLAREVIDSLVATKKHEVIGLVRKVTDHETPPLHAEYKLTQGSQDPAQYPSLPGVQWVQTTYEDKADLVRLFKGVEVVLCFWPVNLDHGSVKQKRLIDAAVEAGVKRFAPSDGVKLESSLDAMAWYAGKIEITRYLENLNKEKKVIEYTRFQIGAFMNYLGHPHQTSTHVATLPFAFDFEKQHATLLEGSLDDVIVWTTVQDIAGVVARAVEYEGEWPAVGGIRGSPVTMREMLRLGEAMGKPFTIEWLKKEDVKTEPPNPKADTGGAVEIDLRSMTPEQAQAFVKMATRGILVAVGRGAYDVTDDWNRILPDYKFTQVEDFLKKVWGGK